jgi:hypothetical protein
MLMPDKRFALNDNECASKVIDGEAVIINLSNGTYYSLENVGAHVWELLGNGLPIARIVESVTAHYDVTREQAVADVQQLIDELIAEKLLLPANDSTVATEAPLSGNGKRLDYVTPALVTFRDMAALLALDPPLPRLEDVVWNEPELPVAQQARLRN